MMLGINISGLFYCEILKIFVGIGSACIEVSCVISTWLQGIFCVWCLEKTNWLWLEEIFYLMWHFAEPCFWCKFKSLAHGHISLYLISFIFWINRDISWFDFQPIFKWSLIILSRECATYLWPAWQDQFLKLELVITEI